MYALVVLGHLDPPLLLEQGIRFSGALLPAHVRLYQLAVMTGRPSPRQLKYMVLSTPHVSVAEVAL